MPFAFMISRLAPLPIAPDPCAPADTASVQGSSELADAFLRQVEAPSGCPKDVGRLDHPRMQDQTEDQDAPPLGGTADQQSDALGQAAAPASQGATGDPEPQAQGESSLDVQVSAESEAAIAAAPSLAKPAAEPIAARHDRAGGESISTTPAASGPLSSPLGGFAASRAEAIGTQAVVTDPQGAEAENDAEHSLPAPMIASVLDGPALLDQFAAAVAEITAPLPSPDRQPPPAHSAPAQLHSDERPAVPIHRPEEMNLQPLHGAELTFDADDLGLIRMAINRFDDGTITVMSDRQEVLEFLRRNSEILHAELKQGGSEAQVVFSNGMGGGRRDQHRAGSGRGDAVTVAPEPVATPATPPVSFTRISLRY
ncbi:MULTISPECIES: hypothetical protein [unclassified Paracoccus (in: a-proteobacteria)]|uniref:hypothetical protein n=1 Tax=unclassified Paracoccus (in: a-proteobacteria) TaxID=2688777 RepID=UPI0012B3D3C0|nr:MULTISPECIES: hypothetical protein [unclassified Paracoccus (in: a-proteobacteria)]UXU75359.1 hypothetical protein GB879_002335 [Paracoccus sp. SMMA_5]UXU81263.1 hypothetical protein GB880_002330 [Paracoccus sp. SMMA_5_TC]